METESVRDVKWLYQYSTTTFIPDTWKKFTTTHKGNVMMKVRGMTSDEELLELFECVKDSVTSHHPLLESEEWYCLTLTLELEKGTITRQYWGGHSPERS